MTSKMIMLLMNLILCGFILYMTDSLCGCVSLSVTVNYKRNLQYTAFFIYSNLVNLIFLSPHTNHLNFIIVGFVVVSVCFPDIKYFYLHFHFTLCLAHLMT